MRKTHRVRHALKRINDYAIILGNRYAVSLTSLKSRMNKLKRCDCRKCFFAALLSFIICVISYLWSNKPLPFLDGLDGYFLLQRFVLDDYNEGDDESLFFSTEVDKELVPYVQENMELGNVAISDRKKILMFLQMLDSCRDSYKYIFLDIQFDEVRSDSAIDAQLFDLISKMERICLVKRLDMNMNQIKMLDSRLDEKAAFNEFYMNDMWSDFRHYPYFIKNEKAAPLRMYEEIDSVKMKKLLGGLLYVQGSNICFGCPILRLSSTMETTKFKRANLLGFSIENEFCDLNDLRSEVNGKIVWIGDFKNDTHSTYIGSVSGTAIAYSAYKSLHEGMHIISWWQVFLELLLYMFIIAALLFSWWPQLVEHLSSSPFLQYVLSFISYGIILTIWSFLLFVTTGTIWNTFIPSISFALIRYLKNKNIL